MAFFDDVAYSGYPIAFWQFKPQVSPNPPYDNRFVSNVRRSTIDCPVSRCPKNPRHCLWPKGPTANLEGGGRLRLPASRKWRALSGI